MTYAVRCKQIGLGVLCISNLSHAAYQHGSWNDVSFVLKHGPQFWIDYSSATEAVCDCAKMAAAQELKHQDVGPFITLAMADSMLIQLTMP